jgi:hypothetical protein
VLVFGLSFVGIAGLNPTGCMNACLLWILCVVRYSFLRRADHPSREVLSSVVCLSVIVEPRHWKGPAQLWGVTTWGKKISSREVYTHTHAHFSPFNLHNGSRYVYGSSVSHWTSCSFKDTNGQIQLMSSNCIYCEEVPVGTPVTICGSGFGVAGVDKAENTTPVW